jgi:hypothetical protein
MPAAAVKASLLEGVLSGWVVVASDMNKVRKK